ncbi:bile acid:sodium symporter family protein [Hyphococcus sp.]|jgi:BASS family bile acid:Na+ symporter|uniref:bile acid:sodium symporter family protein n=1 Tax=Hyphococcus sp. TaxID=2038636 RepID=UPI003D0F713C
MTPDSLDLLTIALSPLSQGLLSAAIIIMIFAIALGLKPEHFSFLKSDPKLFWGGLAAQLIGLPLMTLLLVTALAPHPSIALGMIVVAACPGGNVSNFMTWSARGDTAYSVSLTAGSSVVAALWTPAAILFWSALYPPTAELLNTINFNRLSFVIQTTVMLAAPLTLGMLGAHYFPAAADKIRKPLALFGAGILAIVIIDGFIRLTGALLPAWSLILIPVALHNGAAFALGAGAGRLLGASVPRRRTLAFEVGIQNAGLAIVLLLAQLKGLGGAAAIAAVWGVWHFFSGGAMILLYRTLDSQKANRKRT